MSFKLAKDFLGVHEVGRPNSGILGGKFLEFMKVRKPESSPHCPDYYSVADLRVGQVLNVRCCRLPSRRT